MSTKTSPSRESDRQAAATARACRPAGADRCLAAVQAALEAARPRACRAAVRQARRLATLEALRGESLEEVDEPEIAAVGA